MPPIQWQETLLILRATPIWGMRRNRPRAKTTAVTWSMESHHNFLAKAMCLVFNGKKMMTDAMDKGLAQMKTVVEGQSIPSA